MQLSRHRLEELLAHHTGQPVERIAADIERDYVVRGDEAVEYGLVDEIIHRRRQLNVVPRFTGIALDDHEIEPAARRDRTSPIE